MVPGKDRPQILVLNDDPVQLRQAAAVLEKEGFGVFPCPSVEVALEVLEKQGPVDVVVTDLHMPGIDGWRFCRLLRSPDYAAFREIPILVVSATFAGADAEAITADLGAHAFLSAPYEPSALKACVLDLLEGRRPQTSIRVLLVGLEPSQAWALQGAFEERGYAVFLASTGREGGQLFFQHQPQIVVLNHPLPDLSAERFLQEVKRPGSSTVVVLLTPDPLTPGQALELLRQGADGYIRKPFKPGDLLDLCEKARRERSLLRVEELLEERTRKLWESRDYAQSLIRSSLDMIISVDAQRLILEFNPAAEKTFGYAKEEVLGRPVDLLYADPLEGREVYERVLREGAFRGEILNRKKGGEVFPAYLAASALYGPRGELVGVMGISRDITEQKRVEEALRESEERYRNLYENASDGLASCTLQGIITSVNRGLEAMTGWSRTELLGQHYRKCLTAESAALAEERTRRALAGERLPPGFEVEFVRKDGSTLPVECRTRFIRDPQGRPVGFQGAYRDITAKKALERQRAELVAMLTHDIRNPLGIILGYTEILLEAAKEQGNVQEEDLLGKLRCNALAVHSLVTNYLDLSQIEAGRLHLAREPLEVNRVLLQVGQRHEAEARHRGITLEVHLDPNLPLVVGDPLGLDRVFANLLHNALKFTPKGGKVLLSSARRGHGVVASVADTGPGIAPEEVPLLFEKYRRTRTSQHQEGVGLGLFIAKTFVEAQGGRIEVESTLGQGSCFLVFLPAWDPSSQASALEGTLGWGDARKE